ncbi:MAG TPA: helix-turn-helix transcriptional regulator [Lapillicoccus sp.]
MPEKEPMPQFRSTDDVALTYTDELALHDPRARRRRMPGDRLRPAQPTRVNGAGARAAVRHDVPLLRDRSAALLRRLGASAPRPASRTAAIASLTSREAEILDGLRQGDSNAAIVGRLFLSPKTVEHHVSRIFVKLGVRTRAEAAPPRSSCHKSEPASSTDSQPIPLSTYPLLTTNLRPVI